MSMISSKGKGGMSKSKHTEAQMIGALKQLEVGRKAEDVAREVGVSKHTIYTWKAKYGGMDVRKSLRERRRRWAVEMTRAAPAWKTLRVSHISPASTTSATIAQLRSRRCTEAGGRSHPSAFPF